MFLIIFSTILLILNIYCLFTKKYIYLIFPCILFLPEYYGMEITNSLPLITVSRLMLTIFFMYAFINRKKTIDYIDIFHTLPKTYIFLFSYFFFRIVSNCYYITIYRQSITAIFSIIFEQLCPIIAVFLLQPTKEQTTTIIKTTVYSASALFAIGILESYTRIRPFDSLYTVQREMLNEHYIRLGLYRATTSLGLPVFYGNMCIIILPLILNKIF